MDPGRWFVASLVPNSLSDAVLDTLIELLELAKKQNLEYFQQRLEREIEELEQNFQRLMDMVNRNASVKELIQKTNIKDYFVRAKQISKEY